MLCRLHQKMTATISPIVQLMSPSRSPEQLPRQRTRHAGVALSRSMEEFSEEVRSSFERHLERGALLRYSNELREEYEIRLESSNISMLPSYNHTLPTGEETGDCLALDVGGSTFRIALIRLAGRHAAKSVELRQSESFEIDECVKRLEGQAFFDWMADRIGDVLTRINDRTLFDSKDALPMGLAWSFPIEQTCARSGRLLAMGKGLHATTGLIGQDLSEIIMRSCRARGLNVKMRAIVNDGAATLLSQAYLDSSARMSLILGTGMNSAVFLPIRSVALNKFGARPESWHATAKHVLVNTELSMFGKGIMPTTRWDEQLNARHLMPDFQPMEYLVAGRYIGEIVRLILIEAIDTAGLFNGRRPANFSEEYSLSTKTIAAFEIDTTPDLTKACSSFLQAHPLRVRPNKTDLLFIRQVVTCVSHRAQAYLATAVHGLWSLRSQAESLVTSNQHITVACNGTVMERYPNFRVNCQRHLDELCAASGAAAGTISLEMAPESSIYGAAVAVSSLADT